MSVAVTYGGELAAARESLNNLDIRLSGSRSDTQMHGVAIALNQLYRVLYRHAALLTGNGHSQLLGALSAAAQHTTALPSDAPLSSWPSSTAAPPQLAGTLDHLTVAADILFSHVGPDGAARTPTGIAVLAGVDRDPHLAAIAQLAASAAGIHSRYRADFEPEADRATDDPIRQLGAAARTAARSGANNGTWLTASRPAIDVSNGSWPSVTSHPDVHEALEATRTWLAQHYATDLTGQHIRQLVGAGLALIHELGHIGLRYHEGLTSELRARHIIQTWRDAYHATDNIITLNPARDAAGPAALVNTERWLRRQLRTDETWRADALPSPNTSAGKQWLETARALARALPDIATMLQHGTRFSVARNDFYTLDISYDGSRLAREPEWVCASLHTPAVARLVTAMQELRTSAALFCHLLEVVPHTGVHEAARTNRRLAATPPKGIQHPDLDPTASLLFRLSLPQPLSPEPLPPAAATLQTRVHHVDTRGGDNTKIPIALARSVVAEVQQLQNEVAQLAARITGSATQGAPQPDGLAQQPSTLRHNPAVRAETNATELGPEAQGSELSEPNLG